MLKNAGKKKVKDEEWERDWRQTGDEEMGRGIKERRREWWYGSLEDFACLLSFLSLEGRMFPDVLNLIYSFTVYENVGGL